MSVYKNDIMCVFLNLFPCQRNKSTLKLDLMLSPKIDMLDPLIFIFLERFSED